MTVYLAAYDTEWGPDGFSPEEVEVIADIHRRHNAPATFFIVGKLLEISEHARKLRHVLDDELFDIQSHTYRHLLLKDNRLGGKGLALDEIEMEVVKTNEIITRVFGRKVMGLRTPAGFHRGLRGEPRILEILWRNSIRFLSADLRGPGDMLPSPLKEPFWYADEGFSELLELPGHSWHDNVLKGYTEHPISWPPPPGFLYPPKPPRTAQDEFKVYRREIDCAISGGVVWRCTPSPGDASVPTTPPEEDFTYYSPVLHPWSLCRVEPGARTVELLLSYAEAKGMAVMNFVQMYRELLMTGQPPLRMETPVVA